MKHLLGERWSTGYGRRRGDVKRERVRPSMGFGEDAVLILARIDFEKRLDSLGGRKAPMRPCGIRFMGPGKPPGRRFGQGGEREEQG